MGLAVLPVFLPKTTEFTLKKNRLVIKSLPEAKPYVCEGVEALGKVYVVFEVSNRATEPIEPTTQHQAS